MGYNNEDGNNEGGNNEVDIMPGTIGKLLSWHLGT